MHRRQWLILRVSSNFSAEELVGKPSRGAETSTNPVVLLLFNVRKAHNRCSAAWCLLCWAVGLPSKNPAIQLKSIGAVVSEIYNGGILKDESTTSLTEMCRGSVFVSTSALLTKLFV